MDEVLMKRYPSILTRAAILEHQTAILTSMSEQQTALLTYIKNQQTSMNEHQKGFLTSINEVLAKLNAHILQNKVDDEDDMRKRKGEQKVTKINEEVLCDSYVQQLHESPAPWPSRSRTEEKKYRLHIVGEVCHQAIEENGRLKMNVIKGKRIPHIEVILKHGDEQVPVTHHLASVRVELVVLDAKCHFEECTDWPPKEFEDHFMMASKNSSNRMAVEKSIFSLDGGRKVYTVASINDSSWKQKVRLGVRVVDDGSVKERVLEGVSSNEFYVIHERRRDATSANKDSKIRQTTGNSELNSNGKRVHSDTTLQPGASHSQFQGHIQSTQKFGGYAMGEQPSHVQNTCLTQKHPTIPINARNIGGAIPPEAHAPNSDQEQTVTKLNDNHGLPSNEAYGFIPNPPDSRGHVDPSSQNLRIGKRVHIDTTLQLSASHSQFSRHLQSANKFGQHSTGERPHHAQNACSTQNHQTTPIRNIGGAVLPQSYAPNCNKGLPAFVERSLDDNHGIPSKEAYGFMPSPLDSQGHVDPSSQNVMIGKRVHSDTALQPTASYSQFSRHVQSTQKICRHTLGTQPSHARNVCSIKNRLAAPIGNVRGAVPPEAYAPNSDQGLSASVQTRLDDNHGIPSEEAYGLMPNPHDIQGHVDPSSQNLMIDVGNFGGAVPPQAYAPNSGQGLSALLQKRLDDNHHGIPSEEAYVFMPNPPDNQGLVDPSSQNLMMEFDNVTGLSFGTQPQLISSTQSTRQPGYFQGDVLDQVLVLTTEGGGWPNDEDGMHAN